MKRLLLTAAFLFAAFSVRAQTAWPDWIRSLKPDWSDSFTAASLPADVAITPPGPEVPSERARWSGNWQGWACAGQACDMKLAVERVSAEGATLAYATASVAGSRVDRGEASFVGSELHFRLSTGAKLALRLRPDGDMEMSVWKPDTELAAAGVLTQRPLERPHQRVVEKLATPWTHEGQAVSLLLVVYRPSQGQRPWPTLVLNHGSTGEGNRPELFARTYTNLDVARHFTQQGWQVIFPQRRGRGGSGGLYDEGFAPDRSAYSCQPRYSLPGFERALEDLHLVMQHVVARPDVDARRVLLGGISRGGILSTAYAGLHPQQVMGVINFVGGWLGDACPQVEQVNPVLFRRGAAYPRATLWLYGDNDSFYSLRHSRANFEAFRAAGGQGRFVSYELPAGQNGHFIANRPQLWATDVDAYLRGIVAP